MINKDASISLMDVVVLYLRATYINLKSSYDLKLRGREVLKGKTLNISHMLLLFFNFLTNTGKYFSA